MRANIVPHHSLSMPVVGDLERDRNSDTVTIFNRLWNVIELLNCLNIERSILLEYYYMYFLADHTPTPHTHTHTHTHLILQATQ